MGDSLLPEDREAFYQRLKVVIGVAQEAKDAALKAGQAARSAEQAVKDGQRVDADQSSRLTALDVRLATFESEVKDRVHAEVTKRLEEIKSSAQNARAANWVPTLLTLLTVVGYIVAYLLGVPIPNN